MRQFITIGHKPSGEVEVIHGPDKSFGEHRDEFRNLGAGKKKKDSAHGYAKIEVVDLSRGVVKTRSYGKVKMKGVSDTGKRTKPSVVVDGKRVPPEKAEEQEAPKRARKGYRFGQRRSIKDIMPDATPEPWSKKVRKAVSPKASTVADEGVFPPLDSVEG